MNDLKFSRVRVSDKPLSAIDHIISSLPEREASEREFDYLNRVYRGGGMFAEHVEPLDRFVRNHSRGRADYCYFMFDRIGGGIKIGRSKSPGERRARLSSSGACSMVLLAVVRGGALEGMYHQAFAAHRIAGEWFEPHPDILAEIARLTPREPELEK